MLTKRCDLLGESFPAEMAFSNWMDGAGGNGRWIGLNLTRWLILFYDSTS